jgi:hypothetical protein
MKDRDGFMFTSWKFFAAVVIVMALSPRLGFSQTLQEIAATPTSFLPRDAGEDEGGGLNGAERLNGLNVLNLKARSNP